MNWKNQCKFTSLQLIVCFLLVASTACKKTDELDVKYEVIQLPVTGKIQSVINNGVEFVFVGGDVDQQGFVVTANHILSQFKVRKADFNYPIYTAYQTSERYIFGGGDAQIIYSKDLKSFENHSFLEDNWPNEQFKLPLRRFAIDSKHSTWYLAGGGDFQFGLIYSSVDSGATWVPSEFPNEIHGITFTQNGVAAAGNGIVITSDFAGKNWSRKRLDHQLITGVSKKYCVSFNGDFYSVSDDFSNFSNQKASGNAKYFTRLIELNHAVYSHVSVGKMGNLAFINHAGSIDGGVVDEDVDFTDAVVYSSEKLLVTASSGKVYLINFP